MNRRSVVLLLLVLIWVVAGVAGYRAWKRVQRQLAAQEVCDAVRSGQPEEALRLSEAHSNLGGEEGLWVVECRALALFHLQRIPEALGLLEDTLAAVEQDGSSWLPPPVLAAAVVETRRARGELQGAWELLEPALEEYPDHPLLLSLELAVRAQLEDEEELLDELARRLPRMGPETQPLLRLRLAERYISRSDPARADALLGQEPPQAPELVDPWFRVRIDAYALAGNARAVAETCRRWLAAGGDENEIIAQHASALSIYGLTDPQFPTMLMLRKAVAIGDELENRTLYRSVYVRLVGTLAYLGHFDEALELYEKKAEELNLAEYFDEEDLRRSGENARVGSEPQAREGRLRFRLSTPETGWAVAVSPQPDEPVDSSYERLELSAAGIGEISRRLGTAPQHWVLLDAENGVRGSGTIWPAAGTTVEVLMEARKPTPEQGFESRRGPADGRRRVFAVVLDCADWRILQYLRQRGDLPVLDALLGQGYRAVLNSDPPNTAAAMESLVYPSRRDSPTFLGLVQLLGDELAGLTFVGDNPFSALSWVMPGSESLFEAVGRGDFVTLNLLFSRGTVDAGRHGELIGPRGEVRLFTGWQRQRELTQEELRLFPALAHETLEERYWLIAEAAADMDSALTAAHGGEVDFLAMRVASLDIFTHGSFGHISSAGQDDGETELYEFYRYLDFRLAELEHALDADDVFIVFSDHGIKTALQHDPNAVFVAAGPQVPHGRAEGTPSFRTVPGLVTRLFAIETPWPIAGFEPFLAQLSPPPQASAP